MIIKKVSTLIMVFLLCLSWALPGYAKGELCEAVFLSHTELDLRNDIEVLVKSHYGIEQNHNWFGNLLLRYGLRKLKKLKTSEDIQERVVQTEHLFNIANRLEQDSFWISDSAEVAWFKRAVLTKGLDSLIKDARDSNETVKSKKEMIRSFFRNRAVKFLINPGKLPYVADREIPAGLLEKVIQDGPLAHSEELISYYKSTGQNSVKRYRQFAKAYSTVFLSVMVYLLLSWENTTAEDVNTARVDQTFQTLDNMKDFLEALDQELDHRGLYK